jgi:hypothetical protein
MFVAPLPVVFNRSVPDLIIIGPLSGTALIILSTFISFSLAQTTLFGFQEFSFRSFRGSITPHGQLPHLVL